MATASRALYLCRLPPLPAATSRRLRPLTTAATLHPASASPALAARGTVRCLATKPATSSLRDSSPNWSNRPPKETILLDGCDFEHWLVVMEPPPGDAANPDVPRDEIIESYIKTLAQVVGSEEEARQKIYSVSTRHYFAFGAIVSEELSCKLKELPKVRWVLPDSYLDVKNKDYGGEPFINGQAVPYDHKYHEEWVNNNKRALERVQRNDRPRNFDRSRNFERRVNTQNFQSRDAPPGQGFNRHPPPGQNTGNMPPPPPPHTTGSPPNYQTHMQNPQASYTPGGAPNCQRSGAPGNQGYPGGNMQGGPVPAYPSSAYPVGGGNPSSYASYEGGASGYQYQGQGGIPNYP